MPNYQHPFNHCALVRHSVIGVWRRSRWDAGRGSSTDCSLPINFLLYDECNLIIMIQELWKWSRQMMPSGTIMMLMMILALTTFLWALEVLRGCNFKLNHIFCEKIKSLQEAHNWIIFWSNVSKFQFLWVEVTYRKIYIHKFHWFRRFGRSWRTGKFERSLVKYSLCGLPGFTQYVKLSYTMSELWDPLTNIFGSQMKKTAKYMNILDLTICD